MYKLSCRQLKVPTQLNPLSNVQTAPAEHDTNHEEGPGLGEEGKEILAGSELKSRAADKPSEWSAALHLEGHAMRTFM